MRKRINHIFQETREPFAALWKWASGHPKRWKALVGWTDKRVRLARKTLEREHKKWKASQEDLERWRDDAAKLRKNLEEIHKDLGKKGITDKRKRELLKRKEEVTKKLRNAQLHIEANIDQKKAAGKQIDGAKERIKFWVKKHTAYRKKWKAARKHHQDTGSAKFESWMLHGLPNNLSSDMEQVVAELVVVLHQTITATSNGTHAVGSYHYYNPCRAVDSAGANMAGVMSWMLSKYGAGGFRELFGPDYYYIKNGIRYSGMFPGHGNHNHTARSF